MTSAAVEQKYGPVVAIVNSQSEPEKRYEVRHASGGSYSCQCMGYRFSKERPRQCRHIRAAAAGVTLMAAPVASRSLAVPQTPKSPAPAVHEEALKAATEILANFNIYGQAKRMVYATTRIEEAIRKFLAQLPAPMPVVEAVAGVRMITLED